MTNSNSAPVSSESLRKVGKVSGLHGLKGELYIYVFSKDVSWIDELKEIILENAKGERRKFLITSLRPFKDGFLVFVEGITDRTAAEDLRSHLVYVDGELFVTEDGDESFYLAEIEGFTVFDGEAPVGVIEGFSSNTVQDLLLVRTDSGIAEIPLVEDFLVEIKFDERKIFMTLPEGLLDLHRDTKK